MSTALISSTKNPQIKKIARLRGRRDREATGLTIIEGTREVQRAIDAGVMMEDIFVCTELLNSQAREFMKVIEKMGPVVELTKEVFAKISYGDRQEGLLAIGRPKPLAFNALKIKENPFFVLVEKIEKPGNLGAIMRTAEASGVDVLIVCDKATDLYNPNVIRASIGAVFSLPTVTTSNPAALKFLQEHKAKIYAATPDTKMIYTQADFRGPAAMVLGSEDKGLSDFWLRESQMRIKIPMHGHVDSLNVSTTAAILMYEALRQRDKG